MRMDSNALWFRDVVSSLFATNRSENVIKKYQLRFKLNISSKDNLNKVNTADNFNCITLKFDFH